MAYKDTYELARNATFQRRLAVALTEQARWTLQIDQPSWPGGITPERFAALQQLARDVRTLVTDRDALTRLGIYVLLPSGADLSDSALQTKVASVFAELSRVALPA